MGGGRYSHPTMMAPFFLVVVLFVCLLLLLLLLFTYFVCPLLYYLHVHDMIRFINVLSWGKKKKKYQRELLMSSESRTCWSFLQAYHVS